MQLFLLGVQFRLKKSTEKFDQIKNQQPTLILLKP